jgi:hypothetical protein
MVQLLSVDLKAQLKLDQSIKAALEFKQSSTASTSQTTNKLHNKITHNHSKLCSNSNHSVQDPITMEEMELCRVNTLKTRLTQLPGMGRTVEAK